MLKEDVMRRIIADCKYLDWEIAIDWLDPSDSNRLYLQVRCPNGVDNRTGEHYAWKGRKWTLSKHMTETELVKTALAAVKAAVEHEMLENFKYRGESIFDPHLSVPDLLQLRRAAILDARE